MNPAKDTNGREPRAPIAPTRSRAVRWVVIALGLLALAAAAGVAFIASELALQMAVRIVVARSEGRLEVDGASGSLLSDVRAKRLVWRGPGATMAADEVAIHWDPRVLWSRGIVVKGLGAQRITLAIQPSDSAVPPPPTLGLPTAVTIDEVAVANFEWTIGTNHGRITGVTLGYAGDSAAHRIERLSLVFPNGTLTGNATIDATPPFNLKGAFAFAGDVQQKPMRADIALAGTLEAASVDATGRAGDARFALHARLTPLAAVALDQLSLDAHDLDLSTWDAALPATRLDVSAEGRPADGGIAGRFAAENAIAGPIDANRVPLRSISARFAWRANDVTLDQLSAVVNRGGRVAGSANVPLAGGAGKWALDVQDIDLKALHSALAATRLSGSIVADLDATRHRFEGHIADRGIVGGIAASFAATLVERRLDVARFQVRAGDGEIAGSGSIELAGHNPFEVKASAKRIDPSRFGKFPAGKLDGDILATGVLEPAWKVAANVAITKGSQIAGVPLSGKLQGNLAQHTVRDAAIDVSLASARLVATGNIGAGADGLAIVFDAPKLAELAPILPARVPKPLTGALHLDAKVDGNVEQGALELRAHGEGLKMGTLVAIGSFDARVSVAAAAAPTIAGATGGTKKTTPDERRVRVDLEATGLTARQGTFSRARASLDGTLAQHKATLAFTGEDLDVEASAHGGLREARNTAGATGWTWAGIVDTLENRGPWAIRLDAPAPLEVATDHLHVGEARLHVADGSVHLGALAWNDGRITTRGTFAGVPLSTLARLGAVNLPFRSTVTLGGEWSLAAAPRLNGSVTVRREQGDLSFGPDSGLGSADRAFRVTSAELSARFAEDAVEATATFRSQRGLNADAHLTIGAVAAAPPGHLSPDAPLNLAVTADLQTLRVLQPWLGTAAIIDGNARAELVARGTLARAPLSGTLRAGAIRIDAPQYGVVFNEGRINARLAEGTITLDELSLAGGAGRFTASGTLATSGTATAEYEAAAGQMTWRAEKFRVLNRPDVRLVVGGSGTVRLKDRKISLDGALVADEGHFEYKPDPGATLGDDVVVKGWQGRENAETRRPNLPLSVDLDLDLGRNLTFSGEGLETGLRGKVRVTTSDDGRLRGRGSIQTVNGIYYAFGQRLVIDRGRLIFDGPLDNPGLDIVALRKNLAVEAGVAVSGTVKVPIIQLTSNPPVPDNEKLSWLVLGHGVERASGADVAALQAASAALLGGGKSVTSRVAESIGLDEISVGRSASPRGSAAGSSDATNQVVSFGKRINDKLTLVYEQGLTVAKNALRLEYSLTRTLTLRAEAGVVSSFGIYYRRVFD